MGTYNQAEVAFLTDKQLVVYAVTRDLTRLSSRESPDVSSAFRLHASIVDASSGKTDTVKEWGTRPYKSEVRVTSGGVLVKTGGILKLYSSDLAQERDLPLPLDPNGTYYTSVSASGQTIVISHYFRKEHHYITHIDVLDANTLNIRFSWDQDPPIFHFSISDDRFASISRQNGVVAMTEFGGSAGSKTVTTLEALKRGCAAGSVGPVVVSDELMVLRDCKEVLLLTATGKSFLLDSFNGNGSTASPGAPCKPYNAGISGKVAIASADPRFVALTLPTLRIKKPLLAESRACLDGLAVAVYDLALKKRVFTLNVDPLPERDYDFALSPDGSKLAVINDRRVSLYSVPAP